VNQVAGEEWKGRKRNSGSGGGSSGGAPSDNQWNSTAFDQQRKEKRKPLKMKESETLEW